MKNKKNKKKSQANKKNSQVLVSFSQENITGSAGNVLLGKFMENVGLEELLNNELSIKRGHTCKYSTSEMIMQFMHSVAMGARNYSQMAMLSNDTVLRTLNNYGDFPVLSTRTRFFNKAEYRNLVELSLIENKIRKKVWNKKDLKKVTLDIDSSVKGVYGNQEGAVKGYNPGKKGQNCYNALFCFVEENRECINSHLRPGNTYTGNGSVEFMKETIKKLYDSSNSIEEIFARGDCGYFDGKLLSEFEKQGIKYTVKVKMTNLKALLSRQEWREEELLTNKGESSKILVTRFKHKCGNWEKERDFVGIRIAKGVKEIKNKKDNLMELPDIPIYEEFCFVTDMEGSEIDIWEYYKKRGECENLIENIKNQMYAGDFLINNFWGNDFSFGLCVLTYNLFVWLMYLSYKRGWRIEPNTFKLIIIKVAGRLVNVRGRLHLRLQKDYYWKDIWIRLEETIEDL